MKKGVSVLDPRAPVGTAVELGLAGYADHIETAFKVAPPVRLVDGGFGCLGVLMRDPKTDTLQCHVCGKWWNDLSNHIGAHGITAMAYRKRYGLLRGYPLCGRVKSAKLRKLALQTHLTWRGKRIKKGHKFLHRKPAGKHPLAYYNAKGLCPEQMERRYEIVAEMAGESVPSLGDVKRFDLPLYYRIQTQYRGNINKWRASMGYDTKIKPRHVDAGIIAALRKMGSKKGRVPKWIDFQRPSSPSSGTITKRFGSWARALHAAGFKARPGYPKYTRGQQSTAEKAFRDEMLRGRA